MDSSNPAMHLMLKLKRNENIRLAKGNDMEDPFFANIDMVQRKIVEKCKNKTISNYVYPYTADIESDREINYRPFNKAIELNDSTILSNDNDSSYIIDDLNTDWALSAIEQLSNIYDDVTIYRLYTHIPFKLKVVVQCRTRMNDIVGPLTDTVLNKINLDEVYMFMRYMQSWTLYMISVAEIGIETVISKDVIMMYMQLMQRFIDDA